MNAVVPDATTAILVIPAVTAAILALTPSYRASARLNVLSSFLTFIAALSLFVRKPETGLVYPGRRSQHRLHCFEYVCRLHHQRLQRQLYRP